MPRIVTYFSAFLPIFLSLSPDEIPCVGEAEDGCSCDAPPEFVLYPDSTPSLSPGVPLFARREISAIFVGVYYFRHF